ncbi:MAG: UPF0280 family protein, partial [Candidatus Bathyarchaeia archaeon]
LFGSHWVIKQSKVLVISDRERAVHTAMRSLEENRGLLEEYIHHNPSFKHGLSPMRVNEGAPTIVKLASEAAAKTGVGPMAAVPGALADLAVQSMKSCGGKANVVENGGEISGCSAVPIIIGIYAGLASVSGRIGFKLLRGDFPIGIGTSSASVGHALSFGEADAAVVVADSASLADAAATAVCNAVRGDGVEASINRGLEVAEQLPIRSALIIRGAYVGTIGKLPKLLKLEGETSELFENVYPPAL